MIEKFEGKYDFLSNFYESEIEFEGIIYPTVEHAFQAAKTLDIKEREEIAKLPNPSLAKRAGRSVKLRMDWENIKDEVMLTCLRAKFAIPELRERLIHTGNEWLVEGNTWHDNYWGDCSCFKCANIKGKNTLGYLLCKVRKEIVDNAEEILVVVDMQNDFTKGVLGNEETKSVISTVAKCIKEHRANGGKVIFTYDTHYADTYMDSQEGRNLPVPHCFDGEKGWEIVDELRPYVANAICIKKPTFGSVELANYLVTKEKELAAIGKKLVVKFVGVCTDICVVSNVMLVKAFLPEVEVVVYENCCAGVTLEKHNAAIETMKSCQVKVINCE